MNEKRMYISYIYLFQPHAIAISTNIVTRASTTQKDTSTQFTQNQTILHKMRNVQPYFSFSFVVCTRRTYLLTSHLKMEEMNARKKDTRAHYHFLYGLFSVRSFLLYSNAKVFRVKHQQYLNETSICAVGFQQFQTSATKNTKQRSKEK